MHVSYDQFFNSPPPASTCTYFSWPLLHSPICVRTYSLKYKHSTKSEFFKSHTSPKILLSHINDIIIVHFKSQLSQCFYVFQLLRYDGNIVVKYVFQSHAVENIFQNFCVRIKFILLSNKNKTFCSPWNSIFWTFILIRMFTM